jgi:hypothetical protein
VTRKTQPALVAASSNPPIAGREEAADAVDRVPRDVCGRQLLGVAGELGEQRRLGREEGRRENRGEAGERVDGPRRPVRERDCIGGAYTATATLYAHCPITDPAPASCSRRSCGFAKFPLNAAADSASFSRSPVTTCEDAGMGLKLKASRGKIQHG